MRPKIVRGALWAAFLLPLAGCSDFIAAPESDPNAVPFATANQLFVAHQANMFLWHGGTGLRFATNWMQQVGGTGRQSQDHERYAVNENDFTPMWYPVYIQGGLIDLRKAQAITVEAGDRVFTGILKVSEALMIGTAAAWFGDIPYSEAVNEEIAEPALDDQLTVYAAVLSLLDSAISDLQSGVGAGPGANDFNFGGDASKWIAAAHSLKARFHLHLVEVDGNSRYTQALAEAAQGISGVPQLNNWTQVHSTNSNEANPWFLWTAAGRAGDLAGNATHIDMVNGGTPADLTDDDPRISGMWSFGVSDFDMQYIGHSNNPGAGDPGPDASFLNLPATSDYNNPIVSCTETAFIIAEAQSALGNDALAIAAAKDALTCQELWWGVDLSDLKDSFDGVSGAALFALIMKQKFVSVFQNSEIWADYKRTCLPVRLPTSPATEIPGRFIYAQQERQTNSNIPEPDQAPTRNANDPNPC
jgi:hypothetical protein